MSAHNKVKELQIVTGWNNTMTARELCVSRNTVQRWHDNSRVPSPIVGKLARTLLENRELKAKLAAYHAMSQ